MYRVFLWLSLGLHGVLLLIPMVDSSPTSSEPLVQSEETVNLVDLLASPASVPPASLPSPLTRPPAPTSEQITNPLPSLSPPTIAPSIQPKPSTSSTPPAPSPTPTSAPESSAIPTSTPTPTIIPPPSVLPPSTQLNSDSVQPFFEQLTATTGLPVNPPAPDLFPDASLYFDSMETEPTLKPDILRAVWMDGKQPGQVYISVLSSQAQSSHLEIEQKPNYGGCTAEQNLDYAACTVYELRQSETIWYLNLVPTQNGNGTVIVVWTQDPSRIPLAEAPHS